MVNYRSIQDLNQHIISGLRKVPVGTDLIVGIPRSGLLAANLLALHLNLPLADLEGFIQGKILRSGERLKDNEKPFEQYRRVVVMDDSVYTGAALKTAKEKLANLYPEKEIFFAAVYVVPDAIASVHFYFNVCPWPRVFEWNMMHHNVLEKCCVDIDGVLCKDPTEEENDDGVRYEQFLAEAQALFLPTKKIGYLVTNRLEKYRAHTEAWLAKHNVKYNQLIMCDLPSKEARLKANNHGGFKASVYTQYDGFLFIESSHGQAQQIANLSGKAVYCMDTRRMVYPAPTVADLTAGRAKRLIKRVLQRLNLL
jgi:uncharacterized HAD superfamily protein